MVNTSNFIIGTRAFLGFWGLVVFALNIYFFWEVISGAGDENPVGILFLFGAMGALIPLFGACRTIKKTSFTFWFWVCLSFLILGFLSSFLFVFL